MWVFRGVAQEYSRVKYRNKLNDQHYVIRQKEEIMSSRTLD
jgi:hypothetical protein